MKSWLALLASPTIALGAQSVMLALVEPSCANQTRGTIHAIAIASLLVTALFAVLAWREWKQYGALPGHPPDSDAGDPASTRRFVAVAATGVGVLSVLVVLGMWVGVFVLWPCGQLS